MQNELRARNGSGSRMVAARRHRPTMQEIAQIAGVSVTTVSHVLSGKRPVNRQTAERILAVIRHLGYVPAAAARKLKSGRSGLVGLVVPDLTLSYFASIAKGVEQAADDADYGVIVCSSSYSPRAQGGRYLDLLRDGTVDGLIYAPSGHGMDQEIGGLARDFAIVAVDEELRGFDGVSSVTSDNLEGGRLLGRHLAQLGHRRAVIIAGPTEFGSTAERVGGVRESFPNALVLHGEFAEETGARLVDDAVRSSLEFSCVVGGNDDIAIGAIRRLRQEGVAVPHDVSVVGFDDVAMAAFVDLTTVRQPVLDLGARAAQLLLAELAEPDRPPTHERLPVELVVRGSSGPPA
jgi:DNA-binding LacI/PurR family transcriptional regulator